MKNYLEQRQNVIEDISGDEINGWLNKMVEYLGGDIWFSKSHNAAHPIVKLWNRKDFMATNELVNFARAVDILEKKDKKWLKRTMEIVAGKNLNNVKGAIFEILALSVFSDDQCKVIPAAEGNPGIDGTIVFHSGVKLNLSIKNYGISNAEKNFQNFMGEVYEYFWKEAEKRKIFTVELVLEMKKYLDGDRDKSEIKKLVQEALNQFSKTFCVNIHGDIANISVRPIKGYDFAREKCSNIFLASSPLHKNEYKNLRDKLDDACNNLVQHKPKENGTEHNGIVIHLHEDADIDSCQEEMQNYLNDNQDLPISFIILYQPTITFNRSEQKYSVFHAIKPVISIKRIAAKSIDIPVIEFFLGYAGIETPKRTLFVDNKEFVELRDVYLYQKGEIFERARVMADGSIGGQLRSVAPGVRLNAVMPLNKKRKMLIVQLNTFENEHLEIT